MMLYELDDIEKAVLLGTQPRSIEFHVLFNADGGPVRECLIEASCLLECESRLKELHPERLFIGK